MAEILPSLVFILLFASLFTARVARPLMIHSFLYFVHFRFTKSIIPLSGNSQGTAASFLCEDDLQRYE